ncbi:YoaK family protein [Streptomyces sp. NPDC059851]|uniref:YoaK family protein n=1 Tax=Streptomyces sp. NPDC059851 TaxID=3346971 RepID=UPI00365E01EA
MDPTLPRGTDNAVERMLRALAELLFPPRDGGGGGAHGALPPLLVGLTFVSGLVDAVGFVGFDRVFVANMTGNVALLGFALAGDRQLSAAASLMALAAFAAGAATAGRMRRDRPAARLFGPLVAVQAVLVAGALAVSSAGAGPLPSVGLLALAMGVQNAVVHRLALPDLTTTVVTRTLTGLAADRWGPAARRRLVSLGALFCGALSGGLLTLRHGPWAALALTIALLAGIALAGGAAGVPTDGPDGGSAGPVNGRRDG